VNSISGPANFGNVSGKLQVSSVSGSVEVGNVGAEARVNSVSGDVGLGEVNGSLNVSSVSGGVKATLVSLSLQGIRINSVSGSIEIGFKSTVNADLSAELVRFTWRSVMSCGRVKRSRPMCARASAPAGRRLRSRACQAISR
jgi:DUF4097 and DUF4098 domain-containing protein YvlB